MIRLLAGGLAVVAAVACAAAATWIALRRRPTSAPRSAAGSNEALLVEASRLVAAHKVPVLLAAVLAGAVAGSREK